MSSPSTDVAYLCWSDYVGITRCRGVPASELPKRMDKGLGWAAAGQALTPFDDIANNPWGPMTEVRQTPRAETAVRLDLWPGTPAFHMLMCDFEPQRRHQLGMLHAQLHEEGAQRFRG